MTCVCVSATGLEGEERSSLSDGWYMLSTMSSATRTIAEWYCWLRGQCARAGPTIGRSIRSD